MDFNQQLQELHKQSGIDIEKFKRDILSRAIVMFRIDIEDPKLTSQSAEPDAFMLRANQIGISLLENGLFSLAEWLYRNLAKETIKYRRDPDRWRHAGALYANTGTACAAQGNIDEAVIEFLKAAKEDERTYNKSFQESFAVTDLLQEYFGKPACNIALAFVKKVNPNIALADIEQASKKFGRNEYALWSYVYIVGAHEEANKIFENDFSDLQIFSSIRNLTSLLEVRLKILSGIQTKPLFPTIEYLYQAKDWWITFETTRKKLGATQNSTTPEDDQLREAINVVPNSKETLFWRSLLVAYIARNYTTHQMDISSQLIQLYSSTVVGHILNAMIFADTFQ